MTILALLNSQISLKANDNAHQIKNVVPDWLLSRICSTKTLKPNSLHSFSKISFSNAWLGVGSVELQEEPLSYIL